MEYSEKIFEKETKFKKDPLSELEDNGEIRGSLWIKNRVEIEEKAVQIDPSAWSIEITKYRRGIASKVPQINLKFHSQTHILRLDSTYHLSYCKLYSIISLSF